MEIKDWPSGVNRIILADSGFSHNKNAVVSDKSENGNEMTRLSSSGSPDEWKISMNLSNSRNDSFFKKHGITEYEMFMKWFKYTIAMGTIPFYFGKVGDTAENQVCIYRIKPDGMPSYSFNGTVVKVSMSWTEVYDEFITVNIATPHGDSICAYNGYVEVWFNEKPETTPVKSDFPFTYDATGTKLSINDRDLVMEDFLYDGNKSCVFYYPERTEPGIYTIRLTQTYTDEYGETKTKILTDRFEVE